MKKTPIAQHFSEEDDLPSIDEDDLPGDPLDRPAPDTVYDGVKPPAAPHLQPSLVSVQHGHGPPRQLAIWLSQFLGLVLGLDAKTTYNGQLGVELRSGQHHHHPHHYKH